MTALQTGTEPAPSPQPESGMPDAPGTAARLRAGAGRAGRAGLRAARATAAVVTPLGATVAAAAVIGLIAGLVWQWTELLALGLAALVLWAVAGLSLIGTGRYGVEFTVDTDRVVVGEPAAGRVWVRNLRTRRSPGVRIEVPIGPTWAGFAVPRLAGEAVFDGEFVVPTDRRAVHRVGPVRAVRGDALGLARREQTWPATHTVYVHPRTVALDRVTSGHLRDLDGVSVGALSNDDVAFHALREYERGDDRRAVHWRSSARMGTLMVRQYEETRRWHLAIGLSTAAAEYADADEFETAVSVAASLGVSALTDGRDATVLTHERGLHTGSPRMLLDQMSAVGLGDRRAGIIDLAADITTHAPDVSLAVLIVGGQVDVTTLKTAQTRVPVGARTIAVRIESGAKPGRGRVGELTVLTLAGLADLPRAIRGVDR